MNAKVITPLGEVELVGKVVVEESALDSLKKMVEQLQAELDEALELLEWANGIIKENKCRIGYEAGSPLAKALKFSMKFHDKCTSKPEVLA